MYLDEAIIFSHDKKEHLHHLDKMLTILEDAGINLKRKNCFFVKDEVEYLGNCILSGTFGVYRDAKEIRAICDALFPQTPKMIRSFLGACNVYRRFVNAFKRIYAPLSDILKNDSKTDWDQLIVPTEELQEFFETLADRASEFGPTQGGKAINDRLRREPIRDLRFHRSTTGRIEADGMGNRWVHLEETVQGAKELLRHGTQMPFRCVGFSHAPIVSGRFTLSREYRPKCLALDDDPQRSDRTAYEVAPQVS